MNKDIKITSDHLAHFESLTKLGIKNFFTFNNSLWGNMSLRDENFNDKFDKVSLSQNINSKELIYLGAEQNNNVLILDENNLEIYKLFNKHDKSIEEREIIVLSTDSVITKLTNLPIVVTPADCAIIYIVGTDKKDGKKFLCFIHSGVFGTMLRIYTKTLEIAHTYYDFDNSDLQVFITPTVAGENYRKNKSENVRGKLFTDPEWEASVIDYGEKFGIKIVNKIISDYKKLGIKNIIDSEMDAYEESKKGNLHSFTYYKEIKEDSKNFMVLGMIE